jgi:hypothetical protein
MNKKERRGDEDHRSPEQQHAKREDSRTAWQEEEEITTRARLMDDLAARDRDARQEKNTLPTLPNQIEVMMINVNNCVGEWGLIHSELRGWG